ncbi:MAG: zf-HC2 domain-containing protein [Myxococcales bacterium]|nr:zf-HC2 domain-containing protein [Myxococcales bacterium]
MLFSCKQVSEHLSDHVDDELPPRKRWMLRLHLLMCPPCARVEHSLRRTLGALEALGRELGQDESGKRPDSGA